MPCRSLVTCRFRLYGKMRRSTFALAESEQMSYSWVHKTNPGNYPHSTKVANRGTLAALDALWDAYRAQCHQYMTCLHRCPARPEP